jgi:transposase
MQSRCETTPAPPRTAAHNNRAELSIAPVIKTYLAIRGTSFIVAATFAAEMGDARRFDNARHY